MFVLDSFLWKSFGFEITVLLLMDPKETCWVETLAFYHLMVKASLFQEEEQELLESSMNNKPALDVRGRKV